VIFLPAWTRAAWIEPAYRVAGTAVGAALAAVTAVWEVVLTPMHAHLAGVSFRLPLATVLAVAGNAGLVWFTRLVTGRLGLALVPGLAWFVVILAAATKTGEGDLLIAGDNWVGLLTILLGSLAWAVAAYAAINTSRPRVPPETPPARPAPGPRPVGSRPVGSRPAKRR
jgi:hypothetical protein